MQRLSGDVGNGVEHGVNRAGRVADLGLIAPVFMGQSDRRLRHAVIIGPGGDIKAVYGPRAGRADRFAHNQGFDIGIEHFFFLIGQGFERDEHGSQLIIFERKTQFLCPVFQGRAAAMFTQHQIIG